MPTYVYACTNPDCGHQFEAVQAFTDDALTVCPVCGQRLRKVFGSVGVVFKGSGFYRNDSREKTGASVKSSAGPDGGDGKAKATKSEESSPAANGTAGKPESTKSDGAKSNGGTSTNGSSPGARSSNPSAGGGSSSSSSARGGSSSEGARTGASG